MQVEHAGSCTSVMASIHDPSKKDDMVLLRWTDVWEDFDEEAPFANADGDYSGLLIWKHVSSEDVNVNRKAHAKKKITSQGQDAIRRRLAIASVNAGMRRATVHAVPLMQLQTTSPSRATPASATPEPMEGDDEQMGMPDAEAAGSGDGINNPLATSPAAEATPSDSASPAAAVTADGYDAEEVPSPPAREVTEDADASMEDALAEPSLTVEPGKAPMKASIGESADQVEGNPILPNIGLAEEPSSTTTAAAPAVSRTGRPPKAPPTPPTRPAKAAPPPCGVAPPPRQKHHRFLAHPLLSWRPTMKHRRRCYHQVRKTRRPRRTRYAGRLQRHCRRL